MDVCRHSPGCGPVRSGPMCWVKGHPLVETGVTRLVHQLTGTGITPSIQRTTQGAHELLSQGGRGGYIRGNFRISGMEALFARVNAPCDSHNVSFCQCDISRPGRLDHHETTDPVECAGRPCATVNSRRKGRLPARHWHFCAFFTHRRRRIGHRELDIVA